jgi:hypothetical protein
VEAEKRAKASSHIISNRKNTKKARPTHGNAGQAMPLVHIKNNRKG